MAKPKDKRKYECDVCHDHGFVRVVDNGVHNGEVVPCPKCNPDGMSDDD